MSITRESIIEAAVESLEWDYSQGYRHAHDTDVSEYIHQAIDQAMIYTSDIMEAWERYGWQEPADRDVSDFDSISAAISWSVYESLRDDVSQLDVLEAWIETHAGNDALADVDTEDTEAAYAALVEWMDEH